jgi:hypothetical protein
MDRIHVATQVVPFSRVRLPRPDYRSQSSVRTLLLTIAFGGAAVLYSYYAGMLGTSAVGDALWGGVPDALRPLYTINMFLAAAGFFLFSPYIVFRLAPESESTDSHARFRRIWLFYGLVLIPSALWLPLTAHVIADPSTGAWLAVRLDLFLVAIGTLGLLFEVLSSRPATPRGRRLAILGLLPFCLQTAVLDALVWPAYFPLGS